MLSYQKCKEKDKGDFARDVSFSNLSKWQFDPPLSAPSHWIKTNLKLKIKFEMNENQSFKPLYLYLYISSL